MGLAETAQLAVRLSLKDGLTPGIRNASRALTNFDSGVGRVGKGVGQMAGGFARVGAIMAGAVAGGIGAATKAAIDWQDAFAGVVKTVDEADLAAAGMTFRDLELSLRSMATEMPIAASELAGIAEAAGALGIAGKDITEFTRIAALLGTTTDVASLDAATSLGILTNVIGLTTDEYDNFAAALVDLGNKGASTESSILAIAERAGAAGKLAGVATSETLGWAAAVANLGIEVEAGGSSLQRFFLETLRTVSAGGAELATMGKVAGMTGKEFKTAFEKDATGALKTFIVGLGELDEASRLATLESLGFSDIRITRMLLGLAGDTEGLTETLEVNAAAWEAATAAEVEFEKRAKTVRSSITMLKNNLIEAAMVFGEGVAPAIGRAAAKLSEFLKQDDNRAMLKGLGEDIGKAIDGIDWEKLLGAARGLASAFKPALDFVTQLANLIAKLPPELVGAGAGLVITNKLSGGAIGAGLGNIVGGLGQTLVRSMASQIPLFGRAFVQPVFVTNMGVGGLGGGAGKGGVPGIPAAGGGALAAIGGMAGFAAVAGAAAIAMYYGIPALVGSKPANGQGDAEPIKTPGGGTISGANAGMVRLFTPALAGIAANTKGTADQLRISTADQRSELGRIAQLQGTTNARLGIIAGKPTRFTSNTTVNVNTSVSVSSLQQKARYKERVAKTGTLVAS